MNTVTRYIIFSVFAMLLWGCSPAGKKKTDWNIGLSKTGKRPYDTYIAYESIYYYFPQAVLKNLPADYNFADLEYANSATEGRSLLVVVGKSVQFSYQEWLALQWFVKRGNEVMMLVSDLDKRIQSDLRITHHGGRETTPLSQLNSGSDNINALTLKGLEGQRFGFWGRNIRGFFDSRRKSENTVLLWQDIGITVQGPEVVGEALTDGKKVRKPNMIRYTIGEGHLTLVATPLVLSNFFLLQPHNRAYSDAFWHQLPQDIQTIYWASFSSRQPDDSIWSILWRYPATRWALISILIAATAYLLFQIKRKQRVIPVVSEPVNSSMAFIETVGMLYYNKGDNRNLALKMEQHFLEWVRTRYGLSTSQLNDAFAEQLELKSGMDRRTVQHTISLIHRIRLDEAITDNFLMEFYQYLQAFYQK